jgi:very-short-patch-repair endonuclease
MPRPPRSTSQTKRFAVELRHNLTAAERKLRTHLRNDRLGVNFRRQHAIGPYIADFCCVEKKLILELDGAHHLEQAVYDAERTAFLESQGYRVLRFWNKEVLSDLDGVMWRILDMLKP